MPGFCLIPQHANAFLAAVRSGRFDAAKLMQMTSEQRHAEFADVLGEANAGPTNAAFESKLLLKNVQEGIVSWAKQVTANPATQRDLLARVDRMDSRVLEPAALQSFLGDLAQQKLGFGVSMQEAGEIASLAKDVSTAKATAQFDPVTGEAAGGRDAALAYGRAKYDFGEYVAGLKNDAQPSAKKDLGVAMDATKSPGTRVKAAASAAGRSVKALPGLSKSVLASLDDSALGRQGWKTLWTNPGVWAKNAGKSFVDIYNTIGGKAVEREAMADILSRPNAINGRYKKMGLSIGNTEEAFPTSLPEKIPGAGRVYKASENAFSLFQYRTRADVADYMLRVAEKANSEPPTWLNPHADLGDKAQLESIGKLVNSLTARGHLGKTLEPAADALNVGFFSARKLKADIDFLTAHQLQSGVTPFVRKQAAVNLVKAVSGMAAILGVAKAINPESVDFDPRSSDFGKIKVGHTRFDVSAGMSSIATLAARLATMKSKSTTTGKVSNLNEGGFASKTGLDVAEDFFLNKLSPVASLAKDILKGQTFEGEKPTVGGELKNMFTPLPLSNFLELHDDPQAANIVAALIADGLGISTNTYGPQWPDLSKDARDAMDRLGISAPKAPKNVTVDKVVVPLPQANRDALTKEFGTAVAPIIEELAKNPAFAKEPVAVQWEAVHAVMTEIRRGQMQTVKDSIATTRKPK